MKETQELLAEMRQAKVRQLSQSALLALLQGQQGMARSIVLDLMPDERKQLGVAAFALSVLAELEPAITGILPSDAVYEKENGNESDI